MQLKCKSLVVIFLILFLSCKNAQKQENMAASSDAVVSSGFMSQPPIQDEKGISESENKIILPIQSPDPILQSGSPALVTDWDKKIIKTADVSVEVKDFSTYDQRVHLLTKKFGAYIAGEQQTKNEVQLQNTITIKVPVEQFEGMMNSFSGDDAKVMSKRITTEDVTDQLVDTKARIEAKKQVRDRYLELLKQAKSMKDIIDVQREINSILEELEAASGRVQFLTHQASYSTINLTYFQYEDGSMGLQNSFFSKIKKAFADGGVMIGNLFLLLVSFWPLVLVIFVVWWLIKKPTFLRNKLGKKS